MEDFIVISNTGVGAVSHMFIVVYKSDLHTCAALHSLPHLLSIVHRLKNLVSVSYLTSLSYPQPGQAEMGRLNAANKTS
ncbi:hypothetical protein Hamer_G023618 [Homarus americanus]|uniref:Uncharacterized protein n=1 Tax=Homarus americanus TaxID=6706 RepID=A0A8J5JI78_HOMAM|nr:hypothetical protein Hamer_G023618 [Homarus americanus]